MCERREPEDDVKSLVNPEQVADWTRDQEREETTRTRTPTAACEMEGFRDPTMCHSSMDAARRVAGSLI